MDKRSGERPWWELPKLPYRPQYLQLKYVMQERQPSQAQRRVQLALALLER